MWLRTGSRSGDSGDRTALKFLQRKIQLLSPGRIAGKCLLRVADCCFCLVRLAKNFIRTNQFHPAFKIGTIMFQTGRQSIDHSADHGELLVW